MISFMKHHDVLTNLSCLAADNRSQAQRADASDADHDPDRSMDSDEERDFADQGPLTDMDMDSYYGGRCREARAAVEAHALLH